MWNGIYITSAILAWAALLPACQKDSSGVLTPASEATLNSSDTEQELAEHPAPISIQFSPANLSLQEGNMAAVRAIGMYPYGNQVDLSDLVVWESGDSTISTPVAAENGLIDALEAGATVITATYKDVIGTLEVEVREPFLRRILVQGIEASHSIDIAEDGNIVAMPVKLEAVGVSSDHELSELTNEVVWSTSNDSVAVFNANVPGELIIIAEGEIDIIAASGAVQGQTHVVVSSREPILLDLTISPSPLMVPLGATGTLKATGLYSNHSSKDLTGLVEWNSGDSAIGSVSGGVVTAVGTGKTIMTATLSGMEASITYQTNAAALIDIELDPANVITPIGNILFFKASGIYSDGTIYDLTSSVDWASSNSQVAEVGSVTPNKGKFQGKSVGSIDVIAGFLDVSSKTSATVSPSVIKSIEISVSATEYPRGRQDQFTATGIFTDGNTVDVTEMVGWTTSSSNVLQVQNTEGSKGHFTCANKGSAQIQAALEGITANVSIQVLDPVVDSLVIVTQGSLPATNAQGISLQMNAMGTMSDSTVQNVTQDTDWSLDIVSDGYSFAALVSNAPGTKGNVTGIAEGTVGIVASINGHSAQIEYVTTEKEPINVEVDGDANLLTIGDTQQMTATLTFTDGSTEIITDLTVHPDLSIVWAAPNSVPQGNPISMDNVTDIGVATAAFEGTATITATITSTKFASEGPWVDSFVIAVQSVCANPANRVSYFCAYLGDGGNPDTPTPAESCTEVCAAHGGYNEATNYWFGAQTPSSSYCAEALNALGISGALDTSDATQGESLGLGCVYYNRPLYAISARFLYTSPVTNADDNKPGYARVCACNG